MNVMKMFDLTDRVAVVTGAGNGLGFEIAEAMAEAGAHVVCGDIDEAGNESAATGLVGSKVAVPLSHVSQLEIRTMDNEYLDNEYEKFLFEDLFPVVYVSPEDFRKFREAQEKIDALSWKQSGLDAAGWSCPDCSVRDKADFVPVTAPTAETAR